MHLMFFPTLQLMNLSLQAAVSELHAKHSSTLGQGDDSEEVAAALRLLLVHAEISAGVRKLEAEIR